MYCKRLRKGLFDKVVKRTGKRLKVRMCQTVAFIGVPICIKRKSATDYSSFQAFPSGFSKLLSLYSVEKEKSEESQKLKRKERR